MSVDEKEYSIGGGCLLHNGIPIASLEMVHELSSFNFHKNANGRIFAMSKKHPEADAHLEDLCQRCDGPNAQNWHAPSPIWNQVMRDASGAEKFSIVCPTCFVELAKQEGIDPASWCLTMHESERGIIKATHDGRGYDWVACKWIEKLQGEAQTCQRRMSEAGPWEYKEGIDVWHKRDGEDGPRTCSFCGSVHPNDVIEIIKGGGTTEKATGKSYKGYLYRGATQTHLPSHMKFYLQHFSQEQVDALNAAMKGGS